MAVATSLLVTATTVLVDKEAIMAATTVQVAIMEATTVPVETVAIIALAMTALVVLATIVPVDKVDMAVLVVHITVASTTVVHAPTTTAIAGTAVCVLADHATAGTTIIATTAGAGSHQSLPLIASGVRASCGIIAQ